MRSDALNLRLYTLTHLPEEVEELQVDVLRYCDFLARESSTEAPISMTIRLRKFGLLTRTIFLEFNILQAFSLKNVTE